MARTIYPEAVKKPRTFTTLTQNPNSALAELCRRSFFTFTKEFWEVIIHDEPVWNWHIPYLCEEYQKVAERVARREPNDYDVIVNIPPGTTKSTIGSVLLAPYCWTRWPWMRFIHSSYASDLTLEHAELSRDIVRSDKYQALFPELSLKADKDGKGNFRVIKTLPDGTQKLGGSRYSTSVGGTITGFHGDILVVDDPLNPRQATSEVQSKTANDFMDHTLSSRKVDKKVSTTILIMQRLHENDPTGNWLQKKKKVKHICLPGEIRTQDYKKLVRPAELIQEYKEGLLDPVRLDEGVLETMELDLGQYGFAGQIGQNPVPPSGGMFKPDRMPVIDTLPNPVNFAKIVRYWDKAGTSQVDNSSAAYTAGVRIIRLNNGKYIITDVKRGRWESEVREQIIRDTAEADGRDTFIYFEQEPGSGGKDSAKSTQRNLDGFSAHPDRPTGDKVYRADPFSVAVNTGRVMILRGDWNWDYIDELRLFPFSRYKDQVDASSGAYSKLFEGKVARVLGR